MFIGSFIVQYLIMSAIMVNNVKYITNNLGKAYSSVLMGLFMVGLEIMMHDHQYGVVSTTMYIVLGLLITLFIYLYRKQVAIDDKQYLEGMLEHHSMAILTSKRIIDKTNNYDVSKIAKDILQRQEDEIHILGETIEKIDKQKSQKYYALN
jgi:hydrogenase-4 membrane subunit HyfE